MSISSPSEGGGGVGGGVSPGGVGTSPTPVTGLLTVLTKTVTLPVAGVISVEGAAEQVGVGRWQFELYIDGVLVWNPGSDVRQPVVPLTGILACAAGDRVIELRWNAVPGVSLQGRYVKILPFNNVSG